MKKTLNLLLILGLISITFTGCSGNDDDTNFLPNILKIGDDEYKLAGGILINKGQDPNTGEGKLYDGHEVNLVLYSEGLTVDTNGESKGVGTTITFAAFSSTGTHLDNTTYTMITAVSPYYVGMFFGRHENINEDALMIQAGSLNVERTNNEYRITFNCKDISGKTVTGSFSGLLLYFTEDKTSTN